jgi:TPR repeat protein
MPLALRHLLKLCFCTVLLATPVLRADYDEQYDCRVGRNDIAFIDVFEQLANGLEYNEDGVIVPAEGKRLKLTADTKIAFFHYVAANHPTVSVKKLSRCSSCDGSGGTRRHIDHSGGDYNLGNIVEGVKCDTCNGNGFSVGYIYLVVTYTGELPPLPESPRARQMKQRLYQAQEGDAQAQYEVGLFYKSGKGFKRDLDSARDWLTKSAIQGESRAIPELAELYCDPSTSFYDRAFGLSLFYAVGNNNIHNYKKKGVKLTLGEGTPASKLRALQDFLHEIEATVLGPRIKDGLNKKEEIATVLNPESARRSFPVVINNTLPDPKDSLAILKSGILKYFGLGYTKADKDEGMRLIEIAACKSNTLALTMIALHFDTGVFYQESDSTAWAYYYIASKLGYSDEYCMSRIYALEHSDVGSDWAGYPEILFQYLKSGKCDSAFIRRSQDLSICRFLPRRNVTPITSSVSPINNNPNFPIPSSQGIEFAKTVIRSKYNQVEFLDDQGFSCHKYCDNNSIYYYTVTGVVAMIDTTHGLSLPSTFSVSFKLTNPTDSPSLLYCSVFETREGSVPTQISGTP